MQAAERELKEETGYAGDGELLGVLGAQPGFISMKAHIVLVKVDGKPEKSDLSSDETIDSYKFTIIEIEEMIKKNRFIDMGSVSALMLYKTMQS